MQEGTKKAIPRRLVSHRCIRASSRRTRPRVFKFPLLESLPDELLILILRKLHVQDLLCVRSSHPSFRDLIDGTNGSVRSIWGGVSFKDVWPSEKNLRHFTKAAEHDNVEALVKLGVAYLYNEGFVDDCDGDQIQRNGVLAAKYFIQAETACYVPPFSWLLYRPPWNLSGLSCKERVFENMKKFVEGKKSHDVNTRNIHVCIATTMMLLAEYQPHQQVDESQFAFHVQEAAKQKSPIGAHLLWRMNRDKMRSENRVNSLCIVRAVREAARLSSFLSKMDLCRVYIKGKYGEMPHDKAVAFVRDFIQQSPVMNVHQYFEFTDIGNTMRFILVDWLVEVVHMKNFKTATLHMAVSIVDRFLMARSATRQQLQLLGVTALLLASRYLESEILTIRESSQLTDNAFQYSDIVRMMGEVTATLRGEFRCITCHDYSMLMGRIAKNDKAAQLMTDYMTDLALLQSDLTSHPLAKVSASALLLARLTTDNEEAWPSIMYDYTGFTMADLAPIAKALHSKSFVERGVFDARRVRLQAVWTRYSQSEDFYEVSKARMLSEDEVLNLLGLKSESLKLAPSVYHTLASHDLIMSPSRKSSTSHHSAYKPDELSVEREQAATPTFDVSIYENVADTTEEDFQSFLSNYDGDKELDESHLDVSCVDDDTDQEVSFCADCCPNVCNESNHHDNNDHKQPDDTSTLGQEFNFQVVNDYDTSDHEIMNAIDDTPPARNFMFSLSSMQSGAFIVKDGSAGTSSVMRTISLNQSPTSIDSPASTQSSRTKLAVQCDRKRSPSSCLSRSLDLQPIEEDSAEELYQLEEISIIPRCSSTPAKQVHKTFTANSTQDSGTAAQSKVSLEKNTRQKIPSQMNILSPSPQVKRKSTQALGNKQKTRVTSGENSCRRCACDKENV